MRIFPFLEDFILNNVLVMHGELIKGSGLHKILQINHLSMRSAAVHVNDRKRASYHLQAAVCAM